MATITKSNFIQWKGTDVCMDFHCKCGYHNHYDGYFAYFVQCFKCKQIYKMAESIEMEEVDNAPNPMQSIEDDSAVSAADLLQLWKKRFSFVTSFHLVFWGYARPPERLPGFLFGIEFAIPKPM